LARPRNPGRRFCALASLLALAAVAVAACGGDEPQSGRTPRDVERDLTMALSNRDTVCDSGRYTTRAFENRASYGVPKYAAHLQELCEAHVAAFAARSLRFSGVRVSGDRAKASVVATGGSYGFGKMTFALVHDGVWKVDRMTAFDIDRAKFDAVQRRLAKLGEQAITSEQLDCTLRRYSRLGERELERAIITFDPKLATDPALVCVVRPELRRQGLSVAQAGCIIRALQSNDAFLEILVREDRKATEELFEQAGRSCASTSI
jgi:hypothetical protein